MNPTLSVVIATRNREASLLRLVRQLGAQTLDPARFEIVVVDDGSTVPVAPALASLRLPQALRACRREGVGPGAARHFGVSHSCGDVLVFLDDDMQIAPGFLAAFLAHHEAAPNAVVLGRIDPDPVLTQLSLFERFHARQMDRWRLAVVEGRTPVRGVHLCSGNVSMRRADYDAVGGFSTSLRQSEDRELGIRLELHGCALRYANDAAAAHCSDHDNAAVWLRRAYNYGRVDLQIARLHPTADAHPWRFWALIHPLSKPFVALAMLVPALGFVLARAIYAAALAADRCRLRRLAVTFAAFAYGMEYFRGLRKACGSWSALRREARAANRRRTVADHWRALLAAVRADHDSVRFYRKKYHGEEIPGGRLALDLVRKVGFQMLAWYRLMRFTDACRIPVVPMLISRLIRHLYGAEIHWKADLAPGVSVVHGVGLVLSHAAVVGPGCILFQNVTLGESVAPSSGAIGAPRLGARVHVGPGAMLIGPIDVGEGTKIAAGAVLTRSVAPNSLVAPPEAAVTSRRARPFERRSSRAAAAA